MVKEYVPYSEEIAEEICTTIATTTHGLRKLCADNPHWPNKSNIYKWCYSHEEFRDRYARAKGIQMDLLAEEALDVAYDSSRDTYFDEKDRERCDNEWVQRSRLIVDTIKWYTSKLAPKVYGNFKNETLDNNDAITQFRVGDEQS